jgi:hypothetical protein
MPAHAIATSYIPPQSISCPLDPIFRGHQGFCAWQKARPNIFGVDTAICNLWARLLSGAPWLSTLPLPHFLSWLRLLEFFNGCMIWHKGLVISDLDGLHWEE